MNSDELIDWICIGLLILILIGMLLFLNCIKKRQFNQINTVLD